MANLFQKPLPNSDDANIYQKQPDINVIKPCEEEENVCELKRRNELLETEIRMMKEKFNETQVLLEAIKCQNNK